jgi:(S)-ureidoglycine aminohydrolase
MHNLGHTRSTSQRTHLLQTPDTFVRIALPAMTKASAIVHAAPAMGAAFTQYTAEMDATGTLGQAAAQRFVYVLDGTVEVRYGGETKRLTPGGFAYLPAGAQHRVAALEKARVARFGNQSDVSSQALMGDEDLQVQALLPDDPSHDFAVNLMSYQPGAALSMVEVHVMEHGLLMLEGGGIYRLGESWYPVTAGDFIWMAPFCPQWFGAIGKVPAKYLIYKDSNRHPLGEV